MNPAGVWIVVRQRQVVGSLPGCDKGTEPQARSGANRLNRVAPNGVNCGAWNRIRGLIFFAQTLPESARLLGVCHHQGLSACVQPFIHQRDGGWPLTRDPTKPLRVR